MYTIVLALIFCVSSCKQDANLSSQKVNNGRISLGRNAVVPIIGVDSKGIVHCTGTLIKEHGVLFLLTAAHCVHRGTDNYIVARRDPKMSRSQWERHIARNPKSRTIPINLHADPRYKYNDDNVKIGAQNDIAIAKLDSSKFSKKEFEAMTEAALEIDYTSEISSMQGRVRIIGAGRSWSGVGVMREGKLNLSVTKAEGAQSIMVKGKYSIFPCTETCQGDSGGPLLYKNPKNKKEYVVGVLHGGDSAQESVYANLSNGRFKEGMRSLLQDISCKK